MPDKPASKFHPPWLIIAALVVVLGVAIPVTILTYVPSLQNANSTPQPTVSSKSHQAVAPPTPVADIPGLPGVVYSLGSADRFALLRTKPAAACEQWNELAEPFKQGLAFVDAEVVPRCASKVYVVQARAERKRLQPTDYANRTSYFELGNPPVPDEYTGNTISCSLLRSWTKDNYTPPKVPKLSTDEWSTLSNLYNFGRSQMTKAQLRTWNDYNRAQNALQKYQQGVQPVEDMYTDGANFDKHCYPPSAVFGPNDSLTFYPNHPVWSIRDSAAPVFFSPSGTNTIGMGKAYVIQPGDNPSSVAAKFFDPDCQPQDYDCFGWSQWPLIVAANHLAKLTPNRNSEAGFTFDPSQLKWAVGQTIYIPISPDSD